MAVNGVSSAESRNVAHETSARDGQLQRDFSDLMSNIDSARGAENGRHQMPGRSSHKDSEYGDMHGDSRMMHADGHGASKADDLRQEAADLNAQADDLQSLYDPNDPSTRPNADMAQTLRNRAIALEQRADTIDDRERIAEERQRIREESEALNGGGETTPPEGPMPRDPSDPIMEGWESPETVAEVEDLLTAVPGFEDAEVSDVRFMSADEFSIVTDLATEMGATAEDLELIEGFTQAFPIQFVFVDNLIEDFGAEAAAGGDVTIGNTTTILLDSQFKDIDFTTVETGTDPDIAAAALDAVEFGISAVLEIFSLPRMNTVSEEPAAEEGSATAITGLDASSSDDE